MFYKIKYNDGSIKYQEFDTLYEAFIHNYKEPWEVELNPDIPDMIGIEETALKDKYKNSIIEKEFFIQLIEFLDDIDITQTNIIKKDDKIYIIPIDKNKPYRELDIGKINDLF